MKNKRIIRSLDLDEVSAVGKPAMAGALHKITKSEPEPVIAKPIPTEVFENLLKHIDAQTARINSYSVEKKADTMTTPNDITKDYATLCKHYANVYDCTPEKAGMLLQERRPDLVSKSYDAENARYIQQQIDKRNKVYGE